MQGTCTVTEMTQRATQIEYARSLYQKVALLLDRGDRSAVQRPRWPRRTARA